MNLNYGLPREVLKDNEIQRYFKAHQRVVAAFSRSPGSYRVDKNIFSSLDPSVANLAAKIDGLSANDFQRTKEIVQLSQQLLQRIQASKDKVQRNDFPIEQFIDANQMAITVQGNVLPDAVELRGALLDVRNAYVKELKKVGAAEQVVLPDEFERIVEYMRAELTRCFGYNTLNSFFDLKKQGILPRDIQLTWPAFQTAAMNWIYSNWTKPFEAQVFSLIQHIKPEQSGCRILPIARAGNLKKTLLKTDIGEWNAWDLLLRLLCCQLFVDKRFQLSPDLAQE